MALDCPPTFGKRSVSERTSCKTYRLEDTWVRGKWSVGVAGIQVLPIKKFYATQRPFPTYVCLRFGMNLTSKVSPGKPRPPPADYSSAILWS